LFFKKKRASLKKKETLFLSKNTGFVYNRDSVRLFSI
jgi:hypothetical protein